MKKKKKKLFSLFIWCELEMTLKNRFLFFTWKLVNVLLWVKFLFISCLSGFELQITFYENVGWKLLAVKDVILDVIWILDIFVGNAKRSLLVESITRNLKLLTKSVSTWILTKSILFSQFLWEKKKIKDLYVRLAKLYLFDSFILCWNIFKIFGVWKSYFLMIKNPSFFWQVKLKTLFLKVENSEIYSLKMDFYFYIM